MNREILFRGKRLDNGEWVTGRLITDDRDGKEFIVCSIGYHWEEDNGSTNRCMECFGFEVDPKTVGQYTGMTDKGKNKMFEGDLYRSDSGYIFEVVYVESEACFVGVPMKEPEPLVFLEDIADMERVGSKWDILELLEVLGG